MGRQIVAHSFTLLFRNLGDALKISVGPYLIGIVACILIIMAVGLPLDVFMGQSTQGLQNVSAAGPMLMVAVLACIVIMLFVSAWVAVAWHRFVLLEEYPGVLPAVSGRPIWPYLGRLILLTIVLFLIALPVTFVMGLVMIPFVGAGGQPNLFVALIAGIIMVTVLMTISLRLSLVLPAVSIDRPMGMGDSWRATAPLTGAIFVAVLILTALNMIVSAIFTHVIGPGLVSGVLSLIVNWISIMIGISILTTIYGIAVEGRSLD